MSILRFFSEIYSREDFGQKGGGILNRDPQFENTFDIIRRKELTHTPMLLHRSRYGNFYSYSNFFRQSDLGRGGHYLVAEIRNSYELGEEKASIWIKAG